MAGVHTFTSLLQGSTGAAAPALPEAAAESGLPHPEPPPGFWMLCKEGVKNRPERQSSAKRRHRAGRAAPRHYGDRPRRQSDLGTSSSAQTRCEGPGTKPVLGLPCRGQGSPPSPHPAGRGGSACAAGAPGPRSAPQRRAQGRLDGTDGCERWQLLAGWWATRDPKRAVCAQPGAECRGCAPACSAAGRAELCRHSPRAPGRCPRAASGAGLQEPQPSAHTPRACSVPNRFCARHHERRGICRTSARGDFCSRVSVRVCVCQSGRKAARPRDPAARGSGPGPGPAPPWRRVAASQRGGHFVALRGRCRCARRGAGPGGGVAPFLTLFPVQIPRAIPPFGASCRKTLLSVTQQHLECLWPYKQLVSSWYPAHIEEIDYEEGKVLIHFKRWNHRYDEWFCWDSPYLRPLEKIQLRKEGLHEEEGCAGFQINDQVLACWSDCRFYPAKVTSVNKDGTYTVKFYDGVVQTVKNIHVKAFSKDQNIVGNAKPKERGNEIPSSPEKREKFKEQRKATGNAKKDKDEKTLKTEKRVKQSDKEGKLIVVSEKGKVSEKNISKNGKEDKENISENDMEYSIDTQIEKKPENDNVKSPQENVKETKRKRGRPPITPPTEPSSQTLQPIALELRRRKIPKGGEVPSKRPRIERNLSQEKLKNSSDNHEKDQIRRRSSRLSSGVSHEILNTNRVTTSTEVQSLKDTVCNPKESEKDQLEGPVESDQSFSEQASPGNTSHCTVLSTDASLQEENIGDTESSSVTVRTEEPSAATVTKPFRRSDFLASKKAATVDQDHKFKCKFVDCSKSFRKAKLLHYHMKYFHGVDKFAESQQNPVKRHIQTRASLASEKANQERPKRGRTTAGSLYAPLRIALRSTSYRGEKIEKRRTAVSALNSHRYSVREQTKENHVVRSLRKPREKQRGENAAKEHEKSKERKSKDYGRSKAKKKKKKKKRTKPEYSGTDENTDVSLDLSPEKSVVTKSISSNKSSAHPSTLVQCSESGHHRGKSKTNEEDTMSESSMESLLWSDDDCSQDVDVTTNPDEEAEESDFEIVRCICEVKEENDFMIQCEECLCWQHGVCMGLLEDNVPEKYTCYICQDPPGQRSSLKYWYEKEWLSNGHMHGLAFLEENYSHQNAKKIVATHQLLGDVQRVIEVLHGLQLKMSILKNKEHPDLKLWCHPWKHITVDEKIHTKHIIHIEENCCKEETASYRTWNGTAEKPSAIPSVEESYITSEHCYQKPRAYYPAIEQRLVVETRGSAMDDSINRIRENGDDVLSERLGWNLDREICKMENESKHNYSKVREPVSKKASPEEAIEMKLLEKDKEGVVNSQLQWQLNLLAHVESLQDEVIHRMDFIEKELDVLESWLDYTGELEPPEPLARLPQLKHCIKQLITDLGKVQQIALCCST